jgi:hypothetical protein
VADDGVDEAEDFSGASTIERPSTKARPRATAPATTPAPIFTELVATRRS